MTPLKPLVLLITTSLLVSCSNQVAVGNGDLNLAEKNSIKQCTSNLPASKKIKLQAVSAGCVASLALSKALGQSNPAALICMAGGAAGYMLGKSVAERKCGYISAEKQIQSELAHSRKVNANFANLLMEQQKNIRALDSKAADLLSEQQQGLNKRQELLQLQKQLKRTIAKESYLLQQFTEETQFKMQTINIIPKNNVAIQNSLLTEIHSLQKSILKMRINQNTLEKINHIVTASIQANSYR